MATAGDHLAHLSVAERERLESWLVDFDLAWNNDLLARRAQQLPPGDRLRVPALIEMIKIDLERRWQRRLPPAVLGVACGLFALVLLLAVLVLALPRRNRTPKVETASEAAFTPPPQPQTQAPPAPAPTSKAPAPVHKEPDPPRPAAPGPAAAESSLAEYLPDDTSTVFVVNVRQILDAPLIKRSALAKLREELQAAPAEARIVLNALQLDPLEDIGTVILANAGTPGQDRGLIIVRGRFHPDKIQDMLEALRTNASRDEFELTRTEVPDGRGGKHLLFALRLLKAQPAPVTMYFAPVHESLFVLSPQQEYVVEALEKAGGRRKTALKDEAVGRFAASADRHDSVRAFLRADAVNLFKQGLGAAGLNLEDIGLDQLGTAHGGLTLNEDVRGELVLDFPTPDAAAKLAQSVRDGLGKQKQVLTEKAGQEKNALQGLELLNGIQVIQAGGTVTLRLHLPADLAQKLFDDSALWEGAAAAGREPPKVGRDKNAAGAGGKGFAPAGGRFRIAMPGDPRKKTEEIDSPVGKLNSVSYQATAADVIYGVSYVDYPKSVVEAGLVNTMLNGARDGMLEASKAKLIQEERIKLGAYQGRDLLVEAPGGKSYLRVRMYLVKQRLYMTTAEGARAQVTGDGAKRFLDSFQLLPE